MNRSIFRILLPVLCLCLCLTSRGQCVLDSQSKYQIVIPDEFPANKGLERHIGDAARQLERALKESLGIQAPVVKESAKGPQKAFYLSSTKAVQALGVKPQEFTAYNGVILEKDGDIYITGNDRHIYLQSVSEGYHKYILGTVKALVVFMEDYLGTRFLLPGENGIEYARLNKAEIPAGLNRAVTPRLIYAVGRGKSMFYDYANNNLGLGGFFTYGGHSYYNACPANVYAKEHPEYFALLGGKRTGNGGHLCISNKDVQELIYKEALKRLDAGATTVQVAQTDGYVPCQCEACKAFGGTSDEGEKIWILHRQFAERLLKDRPGKSLHFLCYPPNNETPKTFDSFPDNVVIELCSYSQETFDSWKKIKVKQGFTVYIYNWGWYQHVGITPKTTPRFVARQVQLFAANNVRGIYRCGFGELFGTEGPTYYVFGKMLDNPDADYREIEDDFYRRAYGAAHAPMHTFFNALHSRVEQMYLTPMALSKRAAELPALPANPLITLNAIYTSDLLCTLEKNLDRADNLADSEKARMRIQLVRDEFNYLKNLGNCITLYETYLMNPTQDSFKALAAKLQERNALIASYFTPKGAMKNTPNFPLSFLGGISKDVLTVNGRLRAPVAAPFTWNVKALLDKNILPGTSSKSILVKKAIGKVGKNPEADAWSNAPWQEIGGIQLNDSWCKAQFKLIYDAENLYFAMRSNLKPGQKYLRLGKDGGCWNQDCFEIMIDPSAERQRYRHFIVNPIPDSYFDASYGYILDPLHPLYRDADRLWDGKWTYDNQVNGSEWTCFVTIPFDTLEKKPVSGATWALNVAREAHTPLNADDKGRINSTIDLLLWSPNMEGMTLQDPAAFGDATFE